MPSAYLPPVKASHVELDLFIVKRVFKIARELFVDMIY